LADYGTVVNRMARMKMASGMEDSSLLDTRSYPMCEIVSRKNKCSSKIFTMSFMNRKKLCAERCVEDVRRTAKNRAPDMRTNNVMMSVVETWHFHLASKSLELIG
jgi:hypothetical protein